MIFNEKGRNIGFTLVELLVVISIIAILAGLMLPALGRGKAKAKMAQCLSNLRQTGIGMMQFTLDHGDRLPPSAIEEDGLAKSTRFVPGGNDPAPILAGAFLSSTNRPLYRYVTPSKVFRCAEDKGIPTPISVGPFVGDVRLEPTCFEALGTSYMFNPYVASHLVSAFKNPSRQIIMHEPAATFFCPHGVTNETWTVSWHSNDRKTVIAGSELDQLHGKILTPFLFADGHTAAVDVLPVFRRNFPFVYEATEDWVWHQGPPYSVQLEP